MNKYLDLRQQYDKIILREQSEIEWDVIPGWTIQYGDTKWLTIHDYDCVFKGFSAHSAYIFDTEAEALEVARDCLEMIPDTSYKAVPAWETLARQFRGRIAHFREISTVTPDQLSDFHSLVEEFNERFEKVFK